jgi:hypothetical protein
VKEMTFWTFFFFFGENAIFGTSIAVAGICKVTHIHHPSTSLFIMIVQKGMGWYREDVYKSNPLV